MFLSEHNNLTRTGMSDIESWMANSDFVKRKLFQQTPKKKKILCKIYKKTVPDKRGN